MHSFVFLSVQSSLVPTWASGFKCPLERKKLNSRLVGCFPTVLNVSEVQKKSARDIDEGLNRSPETCAFSQAVWEPQSCCSIRAERGGGHTDQDEREYMRWSTWTTENQTKTLFSIACNLKSIFKNLLCTDEKRRFISDTHHPLFKPGCFNIQ